jgi:hypothetical protein
MGLRNKPLRSIQRSVLKSLTDRPKPDEMESVDMELLKDLISFLKTRKKFWLLPIVIVLIAVGAFIYLSSSSVATPFIYTIF